MDHKGILISRLSSRMFLLLYTIEFEATLTNDKRHGTKVPSLTMLRSIHSILTSA